MGSVSKLIKRRYIIPLLLILSIILLPCTFTIVDGRIVYRFTKTYSCPDIDADDNDFTNLSKLKNVEELNLCGNRFLKEINGIEKLDKLEDIDLGETSIEDFEPLLKIKDLKKVTVSKNQLNPEIEEDFKNKGISIDYR